MLSLRTLRSRRSRHNRKTGVTENKKPGVKRRAIPSTNLVGRICSKLDCCLSGVRNQPHLVFCRGDYRPVGATGLQPGLPTSDKYTYFRVFVKYDANYFYSVSPVPPVNFTCQCGNR